MKNNILLDVHDFPRIPKAGENQRLAYSSAQGVIDRVARYTIILQNRNIIELQVR